MTDEEINKDLEQEPFEPDPVSSEAVHQEQNQEPGEDNTPAEELISKD